MQYYVSFPYILFKPKDVTQLVESCLVCNEALGKQVVVVHTYVNIPNVEAGKPDVQGHPWLHRESEASLGHIITFCKNKKKAKFY